MRYSFSAYQAHITSGSFYSGGVLSLMLPASHEATANEMGSDSLDSGGYVSDSNAHFTFRVRPIN